MEKTGKKISHVTGVLARSVRIIIENILREGGALQEIRMRIGQPLTTMRTCRLSTTPPSVSIPGRKVRTAKETQGWKFD